MAGIVCRAIAALVAVVPLCAQVKFTQATGRISVDIDRRPFTGFYVAPDAPKPYRHPLRAASGVIVTRHFPMEKVAGEATDRPHHRRLWFRHGDVNGIDFWMNETADGRANLGRVVVNEVVDVKSGDKSGSVSALFDWVGPDKKSEDGGESRAVPDLARGEVKAG